jgi:hypothetical protein
VVRGSSLALQRVKIRGDKALDEYFRGRQRRPIINSQNEPQGSVGSPATEWSKPPATNGCVGPHHPDLKVIVVDIDRASIDTLGTWPWPRETMARLVEAVATGRHLERPPAWQLQRYSRDLGQRPGASSFDI